MAQDILNTWILCLIPTFIYLIFRPKYNRKLPPGPPGVPILGNALQLSGKNWLTYTKWNKEYGPIIHLNLAGQDAIVLGNAEVATELLERRSGIYSGRPKLIVIDILTGGLIFAFHQYTETLKRKRKAVHKAMSNDVTKEYRAFHESESIVLISQMLSTPSEFQNHIHRAGNSLVLAVLYGQSPIVSSNDSRITRVAAFTDRLAKAGAPGSYLVEFFTWMRFLPRWMCKWRREAEYWFARDSELVEGLVEGVEKRMDEGMQKPCFMSMLLEDNSTEDFSKTVRAWMAATLYTAGADIISDQMAWFMLAMVLHPEVQKKAQAEIDRVVGRERLPNFGDYDQLTFIRAIVKECPRWRPVDPIGIPHKLDQDDWYNGYFIPKDTICIPNIWAMNHDPDIYGSDAEEFNPERHINLSTGEMLLAPEGMRDDGHVSFGFGRRVCVGRYVANDSMFILIACILWAFEISPEKDDTGNWVIPDSTECVDDGLVTRPKPFPCKILPRFEGVQKVVDYSFTTLN